MKQRSFLSWVYMIVLTIVMSSCQKGCTSSKTIDSESKNISIGDQKGTITVRHIEYKKSKAKPVGISKTALNKSTKYSYAIVWDIDMPFWKQNDIIYEGTDKEVELKEQLERFKIKCSEDGSHFAYGIDDQLMGVMHIFNNTAFEDPDKIGIEYEAVSFGKFSVESFENSDQIIANLLDKGEICTSGDIINENAIVEILNNLEDDHQLRNIAFESWPECSISKKVFSANKIKSQINSSPQFRDLLVQRLNKLTSQDESGIFDLKEALNLVLDIDDVEILNAMDDFILDQWAGFMSNEADLYINKRATNSSSPIQSTTLERYVSKSVSNITKLSSRYIGTKINFVESLKLLVLIDRKKEIDRTLSKLFKSRVFNQNFRDIHPMFTENWQFLSTKHKKLVLKNYQSKISELSGKNQLEAFKFLMKELDCKELRNIKNSHPSLKDQRLPLRCPEAS